ncbi:MAG: hypothetical protein LQ351_006290 [Letrouitia transgressa]|nr:MAG: hypothetical protein LQ351_006290 [Letrouitia transgressa]
MLRDLGNAASDGKIKDEEKDGAAGINVKKSQMDPFGDESNAHVKYRTMEWWWVSPFPWCPFSPTAKLIYLFRQAGMIMIAETISLGILSLPSVLATVGMVPGLILILGLGVLAGYTGFVIGQFKLAHPHVHNMADAGEVMMGPWGRELFGLAQMLFLVFAMASHILTFSIMMNTVTSHGTCSIVFGFAGFLVSLLCTLPRTLLKVSHLAIASFVSIIAAVMVTMIGVAVSPSPSVVVATRVVPFSSAFLAVLNVMFAYSGHVAFFSFISEMKVPRSFPKALFLLIGADTTMYLIVAAVTYHYAGQNVVSPALGSAPGVLPKVTYGVAIPTIVIAGVINAHVAVKYVYVRLFRGTDRMAQRSWSSFGIWALIVLVLWALAWIIAEAIPVFNDLLGLVSSLFASWFTYGLSGVFWLFLNYGQYRRSWRKIVLTAVNVFVVVVGAVACGAGLYASGRSIALAATEDGGQGAFLCRSNA